MDPTLRSDDFIEPPTDIEVLPDGTAAVSEDVQTDPTMLSVPAGALAPGALAAADEADDEVRGPSGAFHIHMASGLAAGQRLGDYRLVRELGEGAFAEVWLAVEEGSHHFQKRVALKILKDDAATEESIESLVNEARVCGHLHHPHLVDVYGVYEEDDHVFIAMEYVEGITLEALLARLKPADLRLPLSVILDIGIQVAEALDHAHTAADHEGDSLDLIHRDLKPGNIILAPRVGAKVTDFGLAKATTNTRTTKVGILRGTPSYVAPEVWGGRRDFTPALDLFALGAILYEMATAEILLVGELPVVIGQALNGSPDADVLPVAELYPELVPVIRDLLQRTPEERTASAWEVVVALQDLRRRLDAPGGLDLFLELVAPIALPSRPGETRRSPRKLETRDPVWSRLITLKLGSDGNLPLSAVASVPGASSPRGLLRRSRPGASVPGQPGPHRSRPGAKGPGARRSRPGAAAPGRPRPARIRTSPGTPAQPVEEEPTRRRKGLWLVLGALLFVVVGVLLLVMGRGPNTSTTASTSTNTNPITSTPAPTPTSTTTPTPAGTPTTTAATTTTAAGTPTTTAATTPAPSPATTPSPSPRSSATPRPTPPVTPAPTPGVTPAPTPAVVAEVTPTPAPVASPGCLVFRSTPPGASVWLGGAATGLHAASSSAVSKEVKVGTYTVGMGIDAPEQSTSVRVEAGQQATVTCNLFSGGCQVARISGACP